MNKKEWCSIIGVNILAAVVIFVIHYFFPSALNNHATSLLPLWPRIDNPHMQAYWGLHFAGQPVFAARALTTGLIYVVHKVAGFEYGTSFALVNFSLLALGGVLISLLAHEQKKDIKGAMISSLLFFTHVTILFSFVTPISSFDDPLHYAALLGVLLCVRQKKWLYGSIAMLVALLARETSIFLYPGFWLLIAPWVSLKRFFNDVFHLNKQVLWMVFLVPLILFGVCTIGILHAKHQLVSSINYVATERFSQWHYNIQNSQFMIESVVSCVMALGPIGLLALMYARAHALREDERPLVVAALVTAFINTPLVFVTARAQEARLFVLPLIFMWPLLGHWFRQSVKDIIEKFFILSRQLRSGKIGYLVILFFAALPVWYWFSFRVYEPMHRGFGYAFQGYLFFFLLSAWFVLIIEKGIVLLRLEKKALQDSGIK